MNEHYPNVSKVNMEIQYPPRTLRRDSTNETFRRVWSANSFSQCMPRGLCTLDAMIIIKKIKKRKNAVYFQFIGSLIFQKCLTTNYGAASIVSRNLPLYRTSSDLPSHFRIALIAKVALFVRLIILKLWAISYTKTSHIKGTKMRGKCRITRHER